MPRSYQVFTPSAADHNPMQTMAFDPRSIIKSAAQYEPGAILAKEFTPEGIIDSFLTDLEAVTGIDLTAFTAEVNDFLTGDWTALLTALFGSSSAPTDSSKVLQASIAGLEDLWNWLFGSATPVPGTSTLSQEVITGLTDLWDWLFGTPTPTTPTIDTSKITGVKEDIRAFPAGRGVLSAVVKSKRFVLAGAASGRGVLAGTVNFIKEEPTLYGLVPDLFGQGRLTATARVGSFAVSAALRGTGVMRARVPEALTIFPSTTTIYGLYPVLSGRGVLKATVAVVKFTVSAHLTGAGVMSAMVPDTITLYPVTFPTVIDSVGISLYGRGALSAAVKVGRFTLPGVLAGRGSLTARVPDYTTSSFVLGVKVVSTVEDLTGQGVLTATAVAKKFTVAAALTGQGQLSPRVPETLVFLPSTGTVFTPTLYTTVFGHGVLKASAQVKQVNAPLSGRGVLVAVVPEYVTASFVLGVKEYITEDFFGRGVLSAAARATNPAGRLAGRGSLSAVVPNYVTASFVLGFQETVYPGLSGQGRLVASAVSKRFVLTGAVTGQGTLSPRVPETLVFFPSVGTVYTPTLYTTVFGRGVLRATDASSKFALPAALAGRGVLVGLGVGVIGGSPTFQTDVVPFPAVFGHGALSATAVSKRFTLPAALTGRGVLTGVDAGIIVTPGVQTDTVPFPALTGRGALRATATVLKFALPGPVSGRGTLTAKVPDITTASFVQGQKYGIQSFTAGRGVLQATDASSKFTLLGAVAGRGVLVGPGVGVIPGTPGIRTETVPFPALFGRGVLRATAVSTKFTLPAALTGRGVVTGVDAGIIVTPGFQTDTVPFPALVGRGVLRASAAVLKFSLPGAVAGRGALTAVVPGITTASFVQGQKYGIQSFTAGSGVLQGAAVPKRFTLPPTLLTGRGVLAGSGVGVIVTPSIRVETVYPALSGRGVLRATAACARFTLPAALAGRGVLVGLGVGVFITPSGFQTDVVPFPAVVGRGVLRASAAVLKFALPGAATGRGSLIATVPAVTTASFVQGQKYGIQSFTAGRGVLAASAVSTKFTLPAALTGRGVLVGPGVGVIVTPARSTETVYPQLVGRGVLRATAACAKFTLAAALAGRGALTGLGVGVFITPSGIQTDVVPFPALFGRGALTSIPPARATNPAGRLTGRGTLTAIVPNYVTASFVLGFKEALTITLFGVGKLTATATVAKFSFPGAATGRGVLTARVPDITTSSFVNGQKFGILSFSAGRGVLTATANSTRAVITAALSGRGALTSRSGGPSIGQLEQSLMNALWLALTGGGTGTVAELQAAFADLMALLGWTSSTNLGTGSPVAPAISAVPILGTLAPATNSTVANDIFGGSTFWSSLMSLLFPTSGGSVGTAVTPTAVTNVLGGASLGDDLTTLATQLFGSATVSYITTVENDIANFINNAISGGAAPTSTNSAVASIYDALTGIPHTNVMIPPSPGTGSVVWDANASATVFNGTATTTETLTWNHTCAATADYLVVRVFYEASIFSWINSVTYAGSAMALISQAEASDSLTNCAIYAMPSPPTGSAFSVSVNILAPFGQITNAAAESDSYVGVQGVGTTQTASGSNSSPSLTIASATGDYLVQAFSNASNSLTQTLTAYNQTSRYNSGDIVAAGPHYLVGLAGDAAGAASVTFTATALHTANNFWCGAATNLIPLPTTIIGSGFRACNTSASGVNSTTGNNLFPNSFFNSTTAITTDGTYSAATANTFTVAHAGWYTVTIAVLIASGYFAQSVGLNLVQNGGNPKRGNTQYIGNNTSTTVFAHTFQVYCSALDTLQPGYNATFTGGPAFTGTIDGLSTYFEVSLNNRSLM